MNDDEPPEEITPAHGETPSPYLQRHKRLYWFQPDRGVYVRSDVLGARSREHVDRVNTERAAWRKNMAFQKRLI